MIDKFYAWLGGGAKPGDTFEYYRGYLALDRGPDLRGLETSIRPRTRPTERQTKVSELANGVYLAWEMGQVTLVQRRYGHCNYGYLAQRRWPA